MKTKFNYKAKTKPKKGTVKTASEEEPTNPPAKPPK